MPDTKPDLRRDQGALSLLLPATVPSTGGRIEEVGAFVPGDSSSYAGFYVLASNGEHGISQTGRRSYSTHLLCYQDDREPGAWCAYYGDYDLTLSEAVDDLARRGNLRRSR